LTDAYFQEWIQCHTLPSSSGFLTYGDTIGLTCTSIFALAQDVAGFLWIGTEAGPVRFDGLEWGTPSAFAGLTHSWIWDFDTADPGALWIGTEDAGLWVLDSCQGLYGRPATIGRAEGLADDDVHTMCRDAAGALWVGTHHGLAVIQDRRVQSCFTHAQGIPDAGICALFGDVRGTVWAGSLHGLLIYEDQRLRTHFTTADGLPDNAVYAIAADSQGAVWVATRMGIAVIEGAAVRTVIREGLPAGEVRALCPDRRGGMWAGCSKGLALLEDRQVMRVWTRKDGLPSSSVWSLHSDQGNWVWVGTENGLSMFPGTSMTIASIQVQLDAEPTSYTLSSGDRHIWIGTDEGFACLDPGAHEPANVASLPPMLARAGVWAVHDTLDGSVWAGGRYGGLFQLDPTTGAVRGHLEDIGAVHRLCPDGEGRLWVGTLGGGLACVEMAGCHLLTLLTTASGLPSDHVSALCLDQDGLLWVGTAAGIACVNRKTGVIAACLTHDDGLPSQVITGLTRDLAGAVWASLRGGGLVRIDPLQHCISGVWTVADGLPTALLNSCVCDRQGAIWVGTARGLARLAPTLDSFLTLSRTLGLPSDHCQDSALVLDTSGSLWVGTAEGIAVIDPARVPSVVPPCVVFLTGLWCMGRELDFRDPPEIEDTDYDILFTYGAVEHAGSAQVTYRTQLIGLEADWSAPRAYRFTRYTNLRPGHYTFRVIARNWGGQWSIPVELTLRVVRNREAQALEEALERQRIEAEVQRATAQRLDTLTKTLIIAQLLHATLLEQTRAHAERLERQAEQERERLRLTEELARAAEHLAQVRQDFVSSASHELRTPIAAMLGFAEMLRNNWQQLTDTRRQLIFEKLVSSAKRQRRLVEDLLLASRLEVDQLPVSVGPINLCELVQRAVEEVYAVNPHQRIHVQGSEDVTVRADPDRAVQVLENLLDNAIKYSPEGSDVLLCWQVENGSAVVRVYDHGPGIPADGLSYLFTRFGRMPGTPPREGRTGTGLGLFLSRKLAKAMGGDLDLEATGPAGSTFTFHLPVA
jgi:signal transduction histidine kinase/ligand-binding sensor domain-containing protein